MFVEDILNKPVPLVYPTINPTCKNILLIDKNIKDSQIFTDSVNASTFPITYSTTSTKSELLTLLKANFTSIDRLAICFTTSSRNKKFLDNQPFFTKEETTNSYSENVTFLIALIKEFNVKNIDFFACNTLNYPNWVNYYSILTKETEVIVGASNDRTGNIKYGGDWVMENTSENVELIYFTKSIEYYTYLLDYNPFWTTTGNFPSGILKYDGYMYVTNWTDGTIGKISLTDPSDNNQSWATTGEGCNGLVIDGSGYIYTGMWSTNMIAKISLTNPSGDNNQSWAATGLSPLGLVIYGGYLYVANELGFTIGKISLTNPSGDNNQSWALIGEGSSPEYLILYNEHLYLADYNNNKILKISLTDPPDVQDWAQTGTPEGLAIYDGYMYVENVDDSTIAKISLTDPSGDNNQFWIYTYHIPSCLVISNSYMYFTLPYENSISRYYMLDLLDWAMIGKGVNALTIYDGYIYYGTSGPSNYLIGRINLADPSDNTSLIQDISGGIFGLTTDGSGYIYFTNSHDTLIKRINISDPSSNQTIWSDNGTISSLDLLVYGEYMYTANTNRSTIGRINFNDPVGDINLDWASTEDTSPYGLATDGEYIYVASVPYGQIRRINISDPSDNIPNWFSRQGTPSLRLAIYQGYIYASNPFDDLSGIMKISLSDPYGDNNINWTSLFNFPFPLAIYDGYIYAGAGHNIARIVLAPPADICFPSGTPIQTDQGIIAIEKINPSIHTINKKKIVHVTKTISKDKYLVCFKKDSLEPNYPSADTTMSKEHKVYYAGKMTEAGELMDGIKVEYNGEILYNILMEEYSQIVVNNLICETLHPDNIVSKMYIGKKTVPKKRNIAKLYKFASISR